MKVFISYRRDDSALAAKLLHGELARHFGEDGVFMDIDDIGYGDDFVAAIDRHLADADVVVVVIGPRWLEMLQARSRGDDWVHEEVRRALALRAATGRPRVIAALVDGAAEPLAGLPDDLQALRTSNMLRIDPRALNESLNALAEAVQGRRFASVADELKRRQRLKIAAGVAGLIVFFGGWVSLFDLLGLDTRAATATLLVSSALPGAPPAPWGGGVVLAAIDEKTVAAVGRDFDATWRAEHARFLHHAADAGARVVAFDIAFAVDGAEAADAELRDALAAVQGRTRVVVGVHETKGNQPRIAPRFAGLVQGGIACAGDRLGVATLMPLVVERNRPEGKKPGREATPSVVMPSLALAAFSGGAEIAAPDNVRRLVGFQRAAQRFDLRFQAFEKVTRPQGGCPAIEPGDHVASQLLDPAGIPPLDQPPQRIAYETVLRGDAQAMRALAGKIVLVGVQLPKQDRMAVAGGGERWGVELHAAQIDAMQRGAEIEPLPWVVQVLLAVALALAGAAVAARLHHTSRPQCVLAVTAVGLAFVVAAVLLYRSQQVLVGIPYGLVALALGAWLAGRFLSGVLR
jgi:CHASE2 domain-containing sensor protein